MSTLSPSTVAINTIAHSLANALNAAAGLDATQSEDLCALLRIAAGEVDRVRKANRKAASAVKRAAKKSETKAEKKSPNELAQNRCDGRSEAEGSPQGRGGQYHCRPLAAGR